jgi:hypothetical protein
MSQPLNGNINDVNGGSASTTGTASGFTRMKWAIDQARRELLDPSRRNRLLHSPLTGKRPWCMAVVGHDPDELYRALCRQENFRGYAFDSSSEQDEPTDAQDQNLPVQPSSPSATESTRRVRMSAAGRMNGSGGRPRLQTKLTPEKLEKRLTKIFREERTLEEEQGVSTLYLALGFLKWFDSDQSEEPSFAPLILVPATMTRVRGSDGYALYGRDEEIVANISLREKLRSARDRDRLRQEVLEGLGWRLYRIWSTDWFRNPTRAADRLLSAIRDAEIRGSGAPLGDHDLEEADDEAISLPAMPDEVEAPDEGAEDCVNIGTEYKECSLVVPCGRSLLDLTSAEVGRLALAVVEAEGPVHTEEVARRIRESFGLQRTGNRILEHVRNALISQVRIGTIRQASGSSGQYLVEKFKIFAPAAQWRCRSGAPT